MSDAVAVAAGYSHVSALRRDGTVWTWGSNEAGQLGNGSPGSHPNSTPTVVFGLTGVIAIAAGSSHTVALRVDGTVWSWGKDGISNPSTPTRVIGLPRVIAIAAGGGHTIVVTSDGSAWAWGENYYAQLGDGTRTSRSTPFQIAGLSGVTAVAAGEWHTMALKSDGTVWEWGYRCFGFSCVAYPPAHETPAQVADLSGVVAIAAGPRHAIALKGDGSLWTWGRNDAGALGDGTTSARATPVRASTLPDVVAISAGFDNSIAVTRDGRVWAWGNNDHGQLGDGTRINRSTPVEIPGARDAVGISAGYYHTVKVHRDGSMSSWGNNDQGQLGDGAPTVRSTPVAVGGLSDVVAMAAASEFTLALKRDGSVWAWGLNRSCELGDGTSANRSSPAPVVGISDATAIAAGRGGVALKSNGTVWTWGVQGLCSSPSLAAPVTGLSAVVAISAGGSHTLALKADGTVWQWGFVWTDDIGSHFEEVPVRVQALDTVSAISAGMDYSLALKRDGSVWAWGSNRYGRLGNGTTLDRAIPVQVPGIAAVSALSAGTDHALALKGDGTVTAWGRNTDGQLGDGTTLDRPTPARVAGFTDAVAISAGVTHSLALRGDGSAWSWGSNTFGQLGDGTFALRSVSVVVVREDGAGGIPTNDWFLDLNPGIAKIIPRDRLPVFLVSASGDVATATVEVKANVAFRAQDVGKPIHVFAYAPAVTAKAAKDGPSCVLTQLTPSGLQQVSASNLQLVGNVASSQRQAVTILANVPASQVAGATFCVGSGDTGAQSVSPANSQCAATVPGQLVCLPPSGFSRETPANSPGPLSGLWWNAVEWGWGITFAQRRDTVFAAWFTYDGSGNPKWYVASNCMLPSPGLTSGTCSGALYEVSGSAFFGTTFNSAAVRASNVGTLQVVFRDTSNASMTYDVRGQRRTTAIVRQVFQTGPQAPTVDFTDLWWNPSEPGWGVMVTQQFGVIFLAWYVYDGAGKPMWYVASNCSVSGNGCDGTLYRTTGPAFGTTFDASQMQVVANGSVSVSFTDANNGVLTYTVNGVTASKSITRQVF